MPSLSERLLSKMEAAGLPPPTAASRLGKALRRRGLSMTPELRRIIALPRRDWRERVDELRPLLEEHLHAPGGEKPCGRCVSGRCSTSLWPAQVAALRDAHDAGGLLGPIKVGGGKALVSLLVPTVVDAQRPLLLVPAALREQTLRHVIPDLRRHWRLNPRLVVESYDMISRREDLLDQLAPDLIVADEVHRLANPKAGRTRRVTRYLRAHPDTVFVGLSGTIAHRSIRNYWHLTLWALHDLAPLPMSWREMSDWADALDDDVDDQRRLGPGVLTKLCGQGETPVDWYRKRLLATPGVIATEGEGPACSLRLEACDPPTMPAASDMLAEMRSTWETPNGDPIQEAVELWRHARELACGFWYRWEPPPPRSWLAPRKAWRKYVSDVLANNRRGVDTPLGVWTEAEALGGKGEGWELFQAWREVKDTYEPTTVPEWIDDTLLRWAAAEARRDGLIVWVEHDAVGHYLQDVHGLPYFGGGDDGILVHRGACAASIRAHGEGKNLQRWSEALVLSPPTSGRQWEQLLGRLHREGQEADEVVFRVCLHAPELRKGMAQALVDARWLEQSLGNRQKLCFADIAFDLDDLEGG